MLHRVAVLALDQVIAFDLGIPGRVFSAALDEHREPLYDVVVCSPDGGPVATAGGFDIAVRHDASVLATADTVVIPTQRPLGALYERGELDDATRDLVTSLPATTRLLSICTGSFVLAGAGLLDGRRATTHWRHTADLQRLFPEVDVDPDVLFVDDGRILTSAGAAAGIDLCLHVIRTDHGAATANVAARICVVPPVREGGQAQFIAHPVPDVARATTGPTRAYALAHLDEPLTLKALADHGGMSVRTFTRRFRDETGMSPQAWLLRRRVDRARQLLEQTDLPIETIARDAGFGSATSLRQHMRAQVGVAPTTYRRTFTTAAA